MLEWLQGLLDLNAPGLEPSKEKTKAATFRDDERPFVRQSRKMARIQKPVSGGFDAIGGEEILRPEYTLSVGLSGAHELIEQRARARMQDKSDNLALIIPVSNECSAC
jgi:hypothetical protein